MPSPPVFLESVAAAGDEDDGDDDEPDPVIVKQIAKTVVHSSLL